MTLYLDQQAGTLGFKTFLIDGNKTSTQDILFAKNQREFVEKVAAYASKLGVDCISTNSMIYANSTIEQEINKILKETYNYNKSIRMVCK